MKKFSMLGLAAAVITTALSGAIAGAEDFDVPEPASETSAEDSWYYRTPPPRAAAPTIAQQKAALRGEQRMARLEALRWYGFSNSRPTAAGMPWTTMYSPAWQQPGGRPFAWHTSNRPIVIYTHSPSVYR